MSKQQMQTSVPMATGGALLALGLLCIPGPLPACTPDTGREAREAAALPTSGSEWRTAEAPAPQGSDSTGVEPDVPRALEIAVEPAEVLAGMFFDGATVRVSARVPDGIGIAISCVGREEPILLNRKGKALGLIWMNVGEVELEGVPDLYLLHTSEELGEMADPRALVALGVGYGALEGRATLTGTEGEDERYFGEFVSLKESDGLYVLNERAVDGEPAAGGDVRVSTDFRLPAKTPPGEYQLLIHGFGEGGGLLLGTVSVQVRQVGMAAFIQGLAMDHGLFYGILAVVVAIVVGLLTGVLFGLGSKKAH